MVASIEAPFTLLEKPMKIVRFDAIESSQMSFGLVPKVFDPVDVISPVGEELGMIDAHVMKFCDVECIVRLESVGVNNAVRSDSLFNDREQGLVLALGAMVVSIFPPRLSKPNTATFPDAPLPRFPLRVPPK